MGRAKSVATQNGQKKFGKIYSNYALGILKVNSYVICCSSSQILFVLDFYSRVNTKFVFSSSYKNDSNFSQSPGKYFFRLFQRSQRGWTTALLYKHVQLKKCSRKYFTALPSQIWVQIGRKTFSPRTQLYTHPCVYVCLCSVCLSPVLNLHEVPAL